MLASPLNPFPGILHTQGVQGIEKRYAVEGSPETGFPPNGTMRGEGKYEIVGSQEEDRGVAKERLEEMVGGLKPQVSWRFYIFRKESKKRIQG